MISEGTWLTFGLLALVSLLAVLLVALLMLRWFFALEWPGIRSGTPFTRYLREWTRDPVWQVRWLSRVVLAAAFLIAVAVGALLLFGALWLIPWHIGAECEVRGGIGCE